MYQVTFHNQLSGTRSVLIDDIDRQTADAVVAKWGDESQPGSHMPDLAIEPMLGTSEST